MAPPNEHCVGPQNEMAGRAASCQGCPNAAICASGAARGADPDLPLMKERMSRVKHKILVLSGKGGVGKSTLTKELGFALGRAGVTVGLVDTDICGPSLPRLTGVRAEELHQSAQGWEPVSVDDNVSIVSMLFLMSNKDEAVVWRGPRKNAMIKNFIKEVAWGDVDVLLFDTPPGTTDEHISTVNFLKETGGVTGAVVVTTPQEVAVSDVRREINFCKKTQVPILGIVENMSGFVCPKCNGESVVFPSKFSKGAGIRLSEEYAIPFLGAVPLDPRLMQSCEDGIPVQDADATSPAVKAIQSVAQQLIARLGEQ